MTSLDGRATHEELRKFSRRDAERWGDYRAVWGRIIARVRGLIDLPAPAFGDVAARFGGDHGEDDRRTVLFRSVAEVLDRHFESERVKAPLQAVPAGC